MIIGIGIDIVDISRIKEAEKRWGQRFLERVFTEGEIKYAMLNVSPHPRLAARFAVKEAMSKAIGTGITGGITWRDTEVISRDSGRPEILLHGKLRKLAESMGVKGIHVSISHDGDHAVAQVVLEG
ncbi:MAG TPA: holo-ACP synthase [Nitrospirota bacterium]|nr:holo-ACP synthase [Nitrospirota bacterium]